MFDVETQKPVEENKRGNLIVSVLGLLALALIVLLIYVANSKPEDKPILPNVVRAGVADFDNYKGKVEVQMLETVVHPNMIGMKQYQVKGRVTNRGDRPL